MVHVIYDFNKLVDKYFEKLNFTEEKQNKKLVIQTKLRKFFQSILILHIKEELPLILIRPNGRLGQIGSNPYLEVEMDKLILKIRKLTSTDDEYQKELDRVVKDTLEQEEDNLIGLHEEPCNKCFKPLHSGWEGLCLDCLDELGLSPELMNKNDTFIEDLKKHRHFFNCFLAKFEPIGTASFKVGHWAVVDAAIEENKRLGHIKGKGKAGDDDESLSLTKSGEESVKSLLQEEGIKLSVTHVLYSTKMRRLCNEWRALLRDKFVKDL